VWDFFAERFRRPFESGFWSQVPDEQTATGVWDGEQEQAILDQCLQQARLEFGTEKYRAFEMVVREGRPAAEVSQALGLAVVTVYNAKYHIVKRIRETEPTRLSSIDRTLRGDVETMVRKALEKDRARRGGRVRHGPAAIPRPRTDRRTPRQPPGTTCASSRGGTNCW